MNSSMRLTRCRVPAPRVRCSCPCDHARGQLAWVVADQTPQRPAIAPASRPDRPSSWQGSMPRRPARERRPFLDEASTAVFRWAAFRRCAFGVEAFASAPLHECLGCGSSHSPEMPLHCGRPRRHRPRRPRRPRLALVVRSAFAACPCCPIQAACSTVAVYQPRSRINLCVGRGACCFFCFVSFVFFARALDLSSQKCPPTRP